MCAGNRGQDIHMLNVGASVHVKFMCYKICVGGTNSDIVSNSWIQYTTNEQL